MELKKKLSRVLVITLTACIALTACAKDDDDDDDDSEGKVTKMTAFVLDESEDEEESSGNETEDPADDGAGDEGGNDSAQAPDIAPDDSADASSEDEPDSSTPDRKGDPITESEVIGEWHTCAIEENGEIYNESTDYKGTKVSDVLIIYFKQGGTGSIETNLNKKKIIDITWRIDDGMLVLNNGTEDQPMTFTDNRLIAEDEDDDSLKFAFKKYSDKVPDDSEPDESEPDESEPDDGSDDDKPATGDEAKYVGEWKSVAVDEDGELITLDDPEYGEMLAEFITIKIKSSGKGKLKMKMYDETSVVDFEWAVESSNKISLTAEGDTLYAELKGDQLVLDIEGTIVYFDKT